MEEPERTREMKETLPTEAEQEPTVAAECPFAINKRVDEFVFNEFRVGMKFVTEAKALKGKRQQVAYEKAADRYGLLSII